MKRALLTLFAIVSFSALMAQQARVDLPADLSKVSLKAPTKAISEEPTKALSPSGPSVKAGLAVTEEQIGETRYDLQTNTSTQNRIYRFPDGTIGATWTFGLLDPNFTDRGTGYNYFDGTSWGTIPGSRIETIRTGWPSYAPWGANGECVLAHTGGVGLSIATRANKGTGAWTESLLPYPPVTGQETYWPRMVTSGTNHDKMHVLALTYPTAGGGIIYEGLDGALLYYRSQDGGTTWDIIDSILPGMTSAEYVGFGGDQYAWAEPRANTLAFVVGDNWTDLFVMKSTDGGDTWTKTTIFEHPYPKFKESTTLVLDTPWVCDGGTSIAIDSEGKVHVAFGLMRVLNDDLTDGNTSYFPYTDGLAYWKEGDAPFDTLAIDSVDARGSLIGYMLDLDQNDTIDFIAGSDVIGLYYLGLSSMPNISIDDNDDIYVVYSGLTEGFNNGIQMYRHVWSRAKFNGESEWTDFIDLTGSILHNYDECIVPSIAASSDNNLHLIYQADEEPGLHVRGDEDAATDNSIIYCSVPKGDYGVGISERPNPISFVTQNFPNPFHGTSEVVVSLTQRSELSLTVHNLMGQQVQSIHKGMASPGYHSLTIDGSRLMPGVYFYTVQAGTHAVTKKMIIQ